MTTLPTIAEFLNTNATRAVLPTAQCTFLTSRIRTTYSGELKIENEFEVHNAVVQAAIRQVASLLQEYEQLVQQELEAARTSARVVDASEYSNALAAVDK